jgi:hypothetical protein
MNSVHKAGEAEWEKKLLKAVGGVYALYYLELIQDGQLQG